MHHFFDAITDNKGNALTGYYVRVTDSSGVGQSLYADTSLTPIISVSGLADAAKVDANGNVEFYIAVGTYTLNIYATDATTLVKQIPDVAMNVDIDTDPAVVQTVATNIAAVNTTATNIAAIIAAPTQATNAANSASAASTSATNAANSATAAASSATAASGSATAASTSATNAANSATAASTSATNASNSATAASNSAANAAASLANLAPSWVLKISDGAGGWIVPRFQWTPGDTLAWLNDRVVVATTKLTNNGDGSYTLTEVPSGLSAGATVMFDYSDPGTGAPAGHFFSLLGNTSTLAGEIGATATRSTNGSLVLGYSGINRNAATAETKSMIRYGNGRGVVSVPATGSSAYYFEDADAVAGAATSTYTAATAMAIGRRPSSTPDVLTNATIGRVVVYPGQLTETQVRAALDAGDPDLEPPINQQVFPKWLAVITLASGQKIVPALQVDWKRNRCWWRGRQRLISDVLITVGDGSYILKKPPHGLRAATGMSVFVDVQPTPFFDSTHTPSGCPFHASQVSSGSAGSTARNEWTISASGATAPGGLTSLSSFISDLGATVAPGTVAHPPNLVASMTATVGIPRGQGIIRYGISQPASGKVLFNKDAYPAQSSSGNVTGYSPQGYFRFGNRYDGTTPLANCSLEQVIIYSQALTAAQVEEVGRFNEYGLTPLALWGDSFNNVQQPMEMLRLHYANAGYTYLPMFSDGMGGRGLNFHYEALTEWVNYWPSLKDFLLVMNEGGFDYSSLALDGVTTEGPFSERQIETYINQIYGLFKTQRGVYMEAHTNLAGDSQLTATTTTALTSAWSAAIYSPAALTNYTIKNTGTEPVEYIASSTVPTGNGSWLAPGGTATVAVDGTASQKLYAKASRSGDTSSLASYVAPGAYDQLAATLANIKATFPSLYCDVNALLQSQAATDSDYLAFRANGKTPQQLHISTASNEIHISWGTAFSGADSGYYWWAVAMLRKLAAIGWVPTKPEAA